MALTFLAQRELRILFSHTSQVRENLTLFEHERSEFFDALSLLAEKLLAELVVAVGVSALKLQQLLLCNLLIIFAHMRHRLHEPTPVIQKPGVVSLRIVSDCEFVRELRMQVQFAEH